MKIKTLEFFTGIGSVHMALRNIGVEVESVGISEVDRYALVAYDAIHGNGEPVEEKTKEEMLEVLERDNVGYNFSSGKSEIPRSIKQLRQLYEAHIRSKNYGDITRIDAEQLPDFDLFVYSPPCFVAGTKVLTIDGYKNIEDITSDDYVMTHKNRYQKVVLPMINKTDHIYEVKTFASEPLLVTEEHPFYVRKKSRQWNNERRSYDRMFAEPEWVAVKDLTKDYYVGSPINTNEIIPQWDGVTINGAWGHKKDTNYLGELMDNSDFWWIVGRYIGDGWCRLDRGITHICCGKHELHEITSVLDKLPLSYNVTEERTTYRVAISVQEMCLFLTQFGHGAENKHLTNTVLDLPCNLLQSFIEGYLSADGTKDKKGYIHYSTVSKALAYDMAQCIMKVYKSPVSVGVYSNNDEIEGRKVNAKPIHIAKFKMEARKQDNAFYEDGYIWSPIYSIKKEEYDGLVYNFEVEEDNSYTVQNVIVHNCKNISIAGKQASLEEGSGTQSSLIWECRKIIQAKKPKYLMFENVANLISERHKPYFDLWCEELEGMGYVNKWAVLNGLNYGVPQRRERVIMISVREDVYDGYELPMGTDDTKRFIDILEPCVEDKYFVTNPDYQDYIHKVVLSSDNNIKNKSVRLGGLFDTQTARRQAGAIWDKYGIAPTLDTCQGGYRQPLVVDGSRIRKITPKEAWRLQGFSDEDFEKAKNAGLSDSKLYERAGRGIVVPMLESVFKRLLK